MPGSIKRWRGILRMAAITRLSLMPRAMICSWTIRSLAQAKSWELDSVSFTLLEESPVGSENLLNSPLQRGPRHAVRLAVYQHRPAGRKHLPRRDCNTKAQSLSTIAAHVRRSRL